MRYPDENLSKVEQRLLDELLTFRASLPAAPPADEGRPVRSSSTGLGRVSWRRDKKRRGRLERITNTAVAAAFLAAFAVFIAHALSSSSSTLAATPKPLTYHTPRAGAPSGREVLRSLAAVAARQPKPSPARGRYAYVKVAGWGLVTRVSGATASSTIDAGVSESWLAPDGSGRIRTVTKEPHGTRYVDDFRPKGGPPLLTLSTNEAALARQLAVGHPASDGPVERFVALTDLAQREPITPRVESVILRLLAGTSRLMNSGSVIDRAGRPGVAVSLDSAYSGALTRYTWIFDPHTGRLLGEEETLIGNPGKLNVRKGSVIAYTTFLTSGWATNTSSPPASTR